MADALIAVPYAATVAASSGVTNANNVLNDRMGRTAAFGAASYIVFDLGSAKQVDLIGVLASDTVSGTLRVRSFTTLANATAGTSATSDTTATALQPDATNAAKRLHKNSVRVIAPVTAQFWRLDFSAAQSIGKIVLADALQAADNMDIGWEFSVVDLGEAKDTALGLEDVLIAAKVLQFNWTWSWLTEAEARTALLDILAYAGTTRPVLVCLDPAATDVHNLIGYGRLVEGVKGNNYAIGMYEASFNLRSRLVLNL